MKNLLINDPNTRKLIYEIPQQEWKKCPYCKDGYLKYKSLPNTMPEGWTAHIWCDNSDCKSNSG